MKSFLTVIFIINGIAAVHGIFLALIIGTSKQGNHRAHRFLAWLMLSFSIGLGGGAYFASGLYRSFPYFVTVPDTMVYLYSPLLYLYIKVLTDPGYRFSREQWFHFLPAVLTFLYLFPVVISSPSEQVAFADNLNTAPDAMAYIVLSARLLQAAIYIGLSFRLLYVHARKVKDSFSSVDKVNLAWMRHMIFGFMSIWLVVALLHGFLPRELIAAKVDDALIYLGVAFFIFGIGYRGLRQPEIFSAPPEEPGTDKTKKYEKSGLDPGTADSILDRLTVFMKEKQPYLEPELTLSQLAESLGFQSHHLSQVINDKRGRNFFRFVNGYRVDAAKSMLSRAPSRDEKLIKIAFDVGFNSLSTFNRVFKEITGQSPSEYRKQNN